MGRARQNKKLKCFNSECINGGAPANFEICLSKDSHNKMFCEQKCRLHYLDNIDEIEKGNRLVGKIKVRQSRQRKREREERLELIDAIFFYSGETFDKTIIARVVDKLALSSRWIADG